MLQSFGGREGQQWASEAWFRGGSRWARPTRLALHRTRETRARLLRKSQTKTQPKTPSKHSKKEKDTLRHTLRHTLQGPHRDCTVPREAATGPLRPSSAARSLSFSLPCSPRCLAPSLLPRSLASQPSAVPRPAATRSLRLTPPLEAACATSGPKFLTGPTRSLAIYGVVAQKSAFSLAEPPPWLLTAPAQIEYDSGQARARAHSTLTVPNNIVPACANGTGECKCCTHACIPALLSPVSVSCLLPLPPASASAPAFLVSPPRAPRPLPTPTAHCPLPIALCPSPGPPATSASAC